MTFMRKFIDLLNMDNWDKNTPHSDDSNISDNSDISNESDIIMSLKNEERKINTQNKDIILSDSSSTTMPEKSEVRIRQPIHSENPKISEGQNIGDFQKAPTLSENSDIVMSVRPKVHSSRPVYPFNYDAFLWQCNSIASMRDSGETDNQYTELDNESDPFETGYRDALFELSVHSETQDTTSGAEKNAPNAESDGMEKAGESPAVIQQSMLFDLNIEQVLEHWEPEHAVREIIANALDEQLLTKSREIDIFKSGNDWHIRDYGRGLQYFHFTQNENREKQESSFLIGKFGVGLKDALGVFYRKGIHIEIDSKYAHITLKMADKSGFDLQTLHAVFDASQNPNMVGTDFVITGISDDAINKAKEMFLCFNKFVKLLEETKYGQVYSCGKSMPTVYINGVQVASEQNFLFSYNITNINAQIKKALNRERTNVGRTAYAETIKNILRQCKSDQVLLTLVNDLKNIMFGTSKDESSWVEVATHAAQTLNVNNNVVFMTPDQRAALTNQQVEILNQSGKTLIMVTDNVYSKISESVNTFETVYREYNDTFIYKFVNYDALTQSEKAIFDLKEIIFDFLKKHDYRYNAQIKISETIKVDSYGGETLGTCNYDQNIIIIKRSVLESKPSFLIALMHEFAHYQHGYCDNSRDFENDLTEMLGYAILDKMNDATIN